MDCDIELEIGTGSTRGEYTVHVVRAPAGGHASGRFTLDIDGIQARLPQLEATVLASAVAARRTLPVAEVAVEPDHLGQHSGEERDLDAVAKHVLAVAGPEVQSPEHVNYPLGQSRHVHFVGRLASLSFEEIVDLRLCLRDDFFDS